MLDEIRKKPQHIKNLYALWGSLFITFVIAGGWLVSIPLRLDNLEIASENKNTAQTAGAFSQFFSGVRKDLNDIFKKPEEEVIVPKEVPATSSKPAIVPASTTPSRTILIATSSSQNR